MEEHSLFLDGNKTFIQPRSRGRTFASLHLGDDYYGNDNGEDGDDDDDDYDHQLFAANRHLETAVDDLTCRPNNKGHDQNDVK